VKRILEEINFREKYKLHPKTFRKAIVGSNRQPVPILCDCLVDARRRLCVHLLHPLYVGVTEAIHEGAHLPENVGRSV
jgi:hypothetical protein